MRCGLLLRNGPRLLFGLQYVSCSRSDNKWTKYLEAVHGRLRLYTKGESLSDRHAGKIVMFERLPTGTQENL